MSPIGPSSARILVVDDDPVFTGLTCACLTRVGFEVSTAADGVEGLELLDGERFDLAIVDLVMPRIDGFRLIALVRGAVRLRHVAIMVVSVRHDDDAFREAMALGADSIERKPMDWPSLPGLVLSTIAKRRALVAGVGAGSMLRAAGPVPSSRAG